MSKFEIEFELQGLKLKIKGEKDDIANLSANLAQQLGALIPSPGMAENPESPSKRFLDAKNITPDEPSKAGKKKRSNRSSSGNASASGEAAVALDWRHSPEKWGTPNQEWNTAEKSLWLLYVVSQELQVGEMSSKTISETFNKHFRQSGEIRTHNVTRDLGVRKKKTPSEVGQDTTKSDGPWFLTDAGTNAALELLKVSLGNEKE